MVTSEQLDLNLARAKEALNDRRLKIACPAYTLGRNVTPLT